MSEKRKYSPQLGSHLGNPGTIVVVRPHWTRDAVLENPIVSAALICFLLGLALAGLVRVVPTSTIASIPLTIIFLASYVLTYQQIPPFPPVGATNKIFYIALAAALIGFVLDLLSQIANYRKLLAVIMPLFIVGWIGLPRFAKLDDEGYLAKVSTGKITVVSHSHQAPRQIRTDSNNINSLANY